MKQVLSPTAAINAVAVIGSMPSILPRRWQARCCGRFSYPAIVGCNSPIQFSRFLSQIAHERTHHLAEAVIAACDDLGEATSQLRDIPRDDYAVLGKKTAQLVHQFDPIRYQATANPMDGLHGQLFNGVRRTELRQGESRGAG
ncbi:hypothetical protein [Mesorhizobium sp. M0435]|uniref:hypothetical protein n=1 Tax=Mesorhizobium sp. M0435 TaxID=2956944 RepID=UPI0033350854